MLKRLLVLLPVLLLGLFSCRRERTSGQVVKDADYKKAEALIYTRSDSAFYYFNRYIAGSKDSLQIAMAYNRMAMIQSEAGDYFGSHETLLTSLRYLHENRRRDWSCLSSDYNELGVSNVNLKNYDAALGYYDQAIKYAEAKEYRLIFLNNKALVYQKKKAYAQALAIYRTVLPQTAPNSIEYARVLSNMARTEWLQNPAYPALPALMKALQIRRARQDLWGQNASFAHLSDFYGRTNPDSAFRYAAAMYAVASRLNSPDDRLEALEKQIRMAPAGTAKSYFNRYRSLADSLQDARAAAKNQFALIRYDAERNKTDNLRLQKENSEKKYQIVKQYILLGAVLLLLVGAVLWYRNAMRASQLRTSKKVHDVVANGLYRMMSAVENRLQVDREELLDQMEVLYEQSRDISYDLPRPAAGEMDRRIEQLLLSFGTSGTKVAIVGNDASFWKNVGAKACGELEQVLQELMVNMKKHSGAKAVVIRFEIRGSMRCIDYRDDGMGCREDLSWGNGLTNTGNRMKAIKGTFIFEAKPAGGLHVQLLFPVTNQISNV
ncbi:tetratricopeptide repeat-containing sensor histidine kinase [Mucilaginibacter sp. AK015]|uniref:tetratricopeptide repeat-containing sensor histidine kinase n=1 Tax=Mucilaginibacter sp. AK015 TaxID=2723072 RepID=UPI00161ECAC0|nr:tetratricopeptide repeat-containing sensor histidine kinase [Mucilaginibacter sp. AK015]MBB5395083.1 signal transduction histidine kinase [Mucilaginibacter sp. AK015]